MSSPEDVLTEMREEAAEIQREKKATIPKTIVDKLKYKRTRRVFEAPRAWKKETHYYTFWLGK